MTKYCIVVPHYRHVPQLRRFLPLLSKANLPIAIVDDGSGRPALDELSALLVDFPNVSLVERASNGGKGAATVTGLENAKANGFSHIILVDADGQHDPLDVVHIQQASVAKPAAIWSGSPQFGDDIPAARLYGREITNILARIEAGDAQLRDAMCGLRVYPVETTLRLCAACGKRLRMEMDTELLVRARWQNIAVNYLDTNVVYPEQGASHFRMGADNLRMVCMHLVLLAGALVHLPLRGWRNRRQAPDNA